MKILTAIAMLLAAFVSNAQTPPTIDSSTLIELLAPAGYDGGLGIICGKKPTVNVYANSQDPGTGAVMGTLQAVIVCYGSGRVPHNVTYQHFDSIVWDRAGNIIAVLPYDGMVPETNVPADVYILVPYYIYQTACPGDLDGNLAQINKCYALSGAHAYLVP